MIIFFFLISEEVKFKCPKITYADLYQVILVHKNFFLLFIEIELVHFGTNQIDKKFMVILGILFGMAIKDLRDNNINWKRNFLVDCMFMQTEPFIFAPLSMFTTSYLNV